MSLHSQANRHLILVLGFLGFGNPTWATPPDLEGRWLTGQGLHVGKFAVDFTADGATLTKFDRDGEDEDTFPILVEELDGTTYRVTLQVPNSDPVVTTMLSGGTHEMVLLATEKSSYMSMVRVEDVDSSLHGDWNVEDPRSPGEVTRLNLDASHAKFVNPVSGEQARVRAYSRTQSENEPSIYFSSGRKLKEMIVKPVGPNAWIGLESDGNDYEIFYREGHRPEWLRTPPEEIALVLIGAEEGSFKALHSGSQEPLDFLDSMAMRQHYCDASPTPKFRGVQAQVQAAPTGAGSELKIQLWGSSILYEDDQGYMECDARVLQPLATHKSPLTQPGGQTQDVLLKSPAESWPCALELRATLSKDGQEVGVATPIQIDVSCSE